jgi:hypothetical protein
MGPEYRQPFGPRLCWQVVTARLSGPRIDASLAMPGHDWIRLGPDGIRRQDLRVTLITGTKETIMMRYDVALIRESQAFLAALDSGGETDYGDQYMRMIPQFDTGAGGLEWLTENLFVGEGRIAGPRRIEYRIHRLD